MSEIFIGDVRREELLNVVVWSSNHKVLGVGGKRY
jgi:hypothetical protein